MDMLAWPVLNVIPGVFIAVYPQPALHVMLNQQSMPANLAQTVPNVTTPAIGTQHLTTPTVAVRVDVLIIIVPPVPIAILSTTRQPPAPNATTAIIPMATADLINKDKNGMVISDHPVLFSRDKPGLSVI